MGQVFDGYDEYGRAIYIDLDAKTVEMKPSLKHHLERQLERLVIDLEEGAVVVTELCVHCGERVHFDGRLDVWFHHDGDVNCEGSGWPAAPTTWKVS